MAPEPGADEVLVGRERRLDVDEADDPVAELGVVEDAAERRVLDVAVAVDEAGHDDRPARVDDRRARVVGDQARRRADGDDAPVAAHGDAPVGQDGRRHREHPVGTVDRDVAVGVGHAAAQSAREALRPPTWQEYRGAPSTVANSRRHSRRAGARRYTPRTSDGRAAACSRDRDRASQPDVVTSAVWDAVKELAGRPRPLSQPPAEPGRASPPGAPRPRAAGRRRGRPAAGDPPGRRGRLGPGRRRRGGRPRRRHLSHAHDRQPDHPRRGVRRRHRRPLRREGDRPDRRQQRPAGPLLLPPARGGSPGPASTAGPGLRRRVGARGRGRGRVLRARAARGRRGDRLDARRRGPSRRRAPAPCRPARPRPTPTCSPAPTSTTRSTCTASASCCRRSRRRSSTAASRRWRPSACATPAATTPSAATCASSTSSTRTCSRAAGSGRCRRRARWRASVSTSRRWSRRRAAASPWEHVQAPAGTQPV